MEHVFELCIRITKVTESAFQPTLTLNGNPLTLKPMLTAEAALLEALLPLSNTSTTDLLAGKLNR